MGIAAPASKPPAIAQVVPQQLTPCLSRLEKFARRYAACFWRSEQGEHARTYLEGLHSDLPRKSVEPIATDHSQPRRGLQRFIGAGKWDDEPVRRQLQREVAEEFSDPQGILILDPSAFAKKGTESVGVKRQWCGRLGKKENCQLGVYLAYHGRGGTTLLDAALYLPREWARSRPRREKCHVPAEVRYRSTVQIGSELLRKHSSCLPHAWVVGDDEFGRPAWFRKELQKRQEPYVLEIPCNTLIRDLEAPAPETRKGRGRSRQRPWERVDTWAHRQSSSRWKRIKVADGAKGPLQVKALGVKVQTRFKRKAGLKETLLVTRTPGRRSERKFYVVAYFDEREEIPLEKLVWVAAQRHRIEERFEFAKGECGMADYEVRSWVGWHHHMTMALLALWFVTLQQRRVGKKNAGGDRADDGVGLAIPAAHPGY